MYTAFVYVSYVMIFLLICNSLIGGFWYWRLTKGNVNEKCGGFTLNFSLWPGVLHLDLLNTPLWPSQVLGCWSEALSRHGLPKQRCAFWRGSREAQLAVGILSLAPSGSCILSRPVQELAKRWRSRATSEAFVGLAEIVSESWCFFLPWSFSAGFFSSIS